MRGVSLRLSLGRLKPWIVRFVKFNIVGTVVFLVATLIYAVAFDTFGFWTWLLANGAGSILQFSLFAYLNLKKMGKMFLRVFPDKPVTQKPAETRMGKGKGNVEFWVAVVKPGRIMFEVGGGLPEDVSLEALRHAQYKFSIKTKIVGRFEKTGGEL